MMMTVIGYIDREACWNLGKANFKMVIKTLAEYHTHCILSLDTVSNPCKKEYDNDPGMRNLLATIKTFKTVVL